jgi:tRNA U34 5-methylaminomethyl-2-thiouridine-forming methyltransferase MnmC
MTVMSGLLAKGQSLPDRWRAHPRAGVGQSMAGDQSGVAWAAGDVPVSRRFDDPYYSLENGLAETRHVFLEGNALAERLRDGFMVAELGVGTGLNLLALAALAEATGCGPLYVGFEAYPMSAGELRRALAPFGEVAPLATELAAHWRAEGFEATVGRVRARIVAGDARRTVAAWQGRADAWFLDGFAPAKNPELWEPALMRDVALHTAPGGTFATYTAAGHVRRALAAAGFAVERRPGYGRKRHMTRGVRETA